MTKEERREHFIRMMEKDSKKLGRVHEEKAEDFVKVAKENMYKKFEGGLLTYFINVANGAVKFRLDESDVLVK